MSDIRFDLLIDLEIADRTPGQPGVASERRRVAGIMRDQRFSEVEIQVTFGELPESAHFSLAIGATAS